MSIEMGELDDILEEIKKNAREDRARVEGVWEKVHSAVNSAESSNDPDVQEFMASLKIVENVSSISECLSRINMQLVEVARIELKRTAMVSGVKDVQVMEEREEIYSSIER